MRGDGSDWTYERALHVYWGDGTEAFYYLANGARTAAAEHAYAAASEYLVRSTIERRDQEGHVGGSSATVTDLVVVTATAPVTIDGLPATSPEGTQIALTAAVADPDGTETYAWTVAKAGEPYASGTGSTFAFIPDDDALYTVSLAVVTAEGVTKQASGSVSVGNVAPELTLTGADTVAEGSEYALTLTAADPGADTLAEWTVDWGDGAVQHLAIYLICRDVVEAGIGSRDAIFVQPVGTSCF